jgi:predicted DsbA family dithiol-disulfide isomerase
MAVGGCVRLRVVEVFADVWCPFAYVGLRRLVEQRAARGRDDVVIRVRAWPLELVNGEPLRPDLVTGEIGALREAVAGDLFQGFDPERFPSTSLPALALAGSAYRRDDATGESVSLALRTALFEEGRDISDPVELGTIARSVDLRFPEPGALQTISADWRDGRARGVIGSPHFFVDRQGYFCPTLNIHHVDDHLHIGADVTSLEAFLTAVFGEPSRDAAPTRSRIAGSAAGAKLHSRVEAGSAATSGRGDRSPLRTGDVWP